MIKRYLTLFSLAGVLSLTSCMNWLDVKPNDRISEDATFSTQRGFEMALNGVYVDLNDDALYGRSLSYEFLEIIAQRYNITKDADTRYQIMRFNYRNMAVESRIASIWERAYHLISNINLILKNCEDRREVLSDAYYNLIKGEALALRAYLHFDLFRMFGPVYVNADKITTTLPYYKGFQLVVAESLTAEAFMKSVLEDLDNAADYLKEDPIFEQQPLAANGANSFYGWRGLRMNYYAVKLLKARAALYMGDKETALAAAKEVIEVQEEKFPWVDGSNISNSLDNPDRVFSSELVFALQNVERNSIYSDNYDWENLKITSMLAPLDNVVTGMFENRMSDYRYRAFMSSTFSNGGTSYKSVNKYKALNVDTLYNQLIPMLRVSEAYYIAAECTEDETTAKGYLNTVLNARDIPDMPAYQSVDEVLDLEYYREFWLEGQLFFYYKRKNYPEIYSATDLNATVAMSATSYVFPKPESETQYN